MAHLTSHLGGSWLWNVTAKAEKKEQWGEGAGGVHMGVLREQRNEGGVQPQGKNMPRGEKTKDKGPEAECVPAGVGGAQQRLGQGRG